MAISAVSAAVDQKNGNTVSQYRVTEKAVYLPDKTYIPLDAVEKFRIKDPAEGEKLPFAVEIFYGAGGPAKLAFEKKKDAQMMAYLIMSSRQGIKWEM